MKTMALLRSFYAWLLLVGDIIGKLLAVLTLPATAVAAYVYFDEITDFFSAPQFDTEITRVTLRCNYVWRNTNDFYAYQRGDTNKLIELCDASDIAVSFEFAITNRDSIARELRSLSVSAIIPGYEYFRLDEIRSVEHLIQHGAETSIQRDWRVETIKAESRAIFEVVAIATIRPEGRSWALISDRMNKRDESLLGEIAAFRFQAEVSGRFDEEQFLSECTWSFDEDEFDDWQKSSHTQITNTCDQIE